MNFAVVLAGPSAVGKTTVMKRIIEKDSRFSYVRSQTTREKRQDGNDGEYTYVSEIEFLRSIENGEMLEYTNFAGNYYGTPLLSIKNIFREGKIPLLILDIAGVKSLRAIEDFKTVAVYLWEELDILESRLYERELGSNPTSKKLKKFMDRKNSNIEAYLTLSDNADIFDAFIHNCDVEKTADKIISLYKTDFLTMLEEEKDVENLLYYLKNQAQNKC